MLFYVMSDHCEVFREIWATNSWRFWLFIRATNSWRFEFWSWQNRSRWLHWV